MNDINNDMDDIKNERTIRLELAMYSSTLGVQHYGIMLKQSKRKNRNAKWNKRQAILIFKFIS